MLQMSPSMRVFVCSLRVDFRKGIDGLAAICRNELNQDPLQGALFIFQSRDRSKVRLLMYDGQGFWLCTKRLSKGKFQWWPKGETIDMRELQTLLWNGNPHLARFATDWRKISA